MTSIQLVPILLDAYKKFLIDFGCLGQKSTNQILKIIIYSIRFKISIKLRYPETTQFFMLHIYTRQTEMRKREEQLRLEEEEMLARVLQLSLQEQI